MHEPAQPGPVTSGNRNAAVFFRKITEFCLKTVFLNDFLKEMDVSGR